MQATKGEIPRTPHQWRYVLRKLGGKLAIIKEKQEGFFGEAYCFGSLVVVVEKPDELLTLRRICHETAEYLLSRNDANAEWKTPALDDLIDKHEIASVVEERYIQKLMPQRSVVL